MMLIFAFDASFYSFFYFDSASSSRDYPLPRRHINKQRMNPVPITLAQPHMRQIDHCTHPVLGPRIGPVIQQQPHTVCMTLLSGPHQRRHFALCARVPQWPPAIATVAMRTAMHTLTRTTTTTTTHTFMAQKIHAFSIKTRVRSNDITQREIKEGKSRISGTDKDECGRNRQSTDPTNTIMSTQATVDRMNSALITANTEETETRALICSRP